MYTVIPSSNLLSLEGYLVQGHIKVSGTVDYVWQTHAIKTFNSDFSCWWIRRLCLRHIFGRIPISAFTGGAVYNLRCLNTLCLLMSYLLSQTRFACDVLLPVLINRFVTSVVLQQICSAFFFFFFFFLSRVSDGRIWLTDYSQIDRLVNNSLPIRWWLQNQ